MIPAIIESVSKIMSLKNAGHVLELGSMNVNGTIRDAISNFDSYHGIDIALGPYVDSVISEIDELPQQQYDTVICCETLEHVVNPWVIVGYLKTRLKKNGLFIVSTPTFEFPEHKFPIDCYRFGIDAYTHFIFKDYNILLLETVKDLKGYPIIVGIAQND